MEEGEREGRREGGRGGGGREREREGGERERDIDVWAICPYSPPILICLCLLLI